MSTEVLNTFARRCARGARGLTMPAALVSGISLMALAGCSRGDAAPEKSVNPAASADSTLPSVLATIGDEKITVADVRARVGDPLEQLEIQYRRARDKLVGAALDSIVADRLLSNEIKKTGKSADDLIAAEMSGSPEPTEAEISAWYKDNTARIGSRTLAQVHDQIAEYLRNDRKHVAYDKLLDRLKTEHKVAVTFEPWRAQFADKDAPNKGGKNATVTLVEFSDFQCPYCQASEPILKQVTQEFGDKVRVVYRQFPIPSLHPFAFKAAEASLCANEQGKFWELHDAMFQDQKKLAVSDLKQTARRLGLDGKKFDNCLDTGRYTEQVQNDMKEGQRLGVNGTPAMFINGTYVEGGMVPFETLEGMIKKELARTSKPGA